MAQAALAVFLLASYSVDAAALLPLSPDMICKETWKDLAECRDRKSGALVQICRLNHLTDKWECKRP